MTFGIQIRVSDIAAQKLIKLNYTVLLRSIVPLYPLYLKSIIIFLHG